MFHMEAGFFLTYIAGTSSYEDVEHQGGINTAIHHLSYGVEGLVLRSNGKVS